MLDTNNAIQNESSSFDIKQELFKYLRFWPFYILGIIIALSIAYTYLRYTPKIYQTNSKVKILDKSDGLELPTAGFVIKRSNINLENEIEILKSYIVLERVVKELNLNVTFSDKGNFLTTPLADLPLDYKQIVNNDSLVTNYNFEIETTDNTLNIKNLKTEKVYKFPEFSTYSVKNDLPFQLKLKEGLSKQKISNRTINLTIGSIRNATLGLKSRISITPVGERSNLLNLSIKGQNKIISERILNALMSNFNKDGILDRQKVFERTIDFIDERFVYLAKELEDVEQNRQNFKQNKDIVSLEVNTGLNLSARAESDEALFNIESQLMLAKALKNTIKTNFLNDESVPANIGLDNDAINKLLTGYNEIALNKKRFRDNGVGIKNPSYQAVEQELTTLKGTITRALNSSITQLETSKKNFEVKNKKYANKIYRTPEDEKLLNSIERQRVIKESLYILLLQKREEAAINLAITEPSIKIVEYALSNGAPISPKPNIIYLGALLVGLLIPFGIVYLLFLLDTKVHTKEDILKINTTVPVVGEIPFIKEGENMLFDNPNSNNILAESFRILSSNVNFLLPQNNDGKGKVILSTSTIKGEGKTHISLNLSLALSSINKKVLLIGSDLRNPQIHSKINLDKNVDGLSNYLYDAEFNWKNAVIKAFDKHNHHHILLSGSIPPNPTHLLTNGRFEKLLEEAKDSYDYIIVDSAPTILVTDTLLISKFADATIFVTRAGHTDKKLLNFSKDLNDGGKLNNMAYVLNGVGENKGYGYKYGYGYGYSYNYGYGYGYNSDESES